MDTCKYCSKEFSIEEFVKNKKAKKGYLPKCKECRREYRKAYEGKDTFQAKKEIVRNAKSQPCFDCKVSYPYYVMDLDHLPGTVKKFNPSRYREYNRTQVAEEVAKCEPVCANCHRIRTYNRLMLE